MEVFKIRLFEEFGALADKIEAIEQFMHTDEFSHLKFKLRWLTILQHSYMTHYLKCLQKRMNIILTMEDYEDYANYLEAKEKEAMDAPVEKKETKKKSNKRKPKKEKTNDQA